MNRNSLLYRVLKKAEQPGENPFFCLMNTCMCRVLSLYGYHVRRTIQKQHPDAAILLVPVRSAGDLFFLKYLFDDLCKSAGIERYVLVVDADNSRKSAESLGFRNLYPLSMLPLKALVVYHRTHLERERRMFNCYAWCMFDLQSAQKYTDRTFTVPNDADAVRRTFLELGGIPGKTVILSPYENTISMMGWEKLPPHFWESLAAGLQSKGYRVFTNCSGSGQEPVIPHTTRIFPAFAEVRDMIDLAGCCIMVRSGFADFAVHAGGRKIVLYPNQRFLRQWSFYRSAQPVHCTEINYLDYRDDYDRLRTEILNEMEDVR